MATIKDLAEQYGVLKDKLNAQYFEPNDSIIASSLMHPQEAARRAKDSLMRSIDTAAGVPREILDESSVFPFGIAPSIDEQAQAGLDLAGLMQTGAMPFAPASAGGTLGTFIGPKSRNWDKVAAELAAKKLDEGADPAEVWREHLIGRMPDKTLFSEISDKDALYHEHGKDFYDSTLNKTNQLLKHGRDTAEYPLNVQDMLAHPNFYENYPNLEATELRYLPETSTSKGAFGYFADNGDPVLNIHGMLPNNEAKSTMLHELQHGIQRDEGWGQGGSPQEFTRQKEAEHARDVLNWRNEVLARKKKYPDTDTNAIENNIIKDYIDMGLFNDFVPSREARELATQPYIMYPERYDHTNEFEKLNNLVGEYGLDKRTTPYTPIEGYKRLTGEAQARATQDRLDMDMAQRRENYPLAGGKLSDIPLEELIYKYEGNGPSLDVHGYGTAKKIADVLNTKYGKDIDADISGNDRGLTLNKLIVDADKRNQGIGSNFLKDLIQYADEESLPMQLTAAGDFGGNKARQVSLYKKYGFLENKGKNKDYSISENMYRAPNDLSELSKYAQGGSVDKDSLQLNKPQRTPNHPTKSHIVKTMVDGKEKIIRFGEQGAETAGKPKEGESDRMTAKRESFKARHAKNIAKGPSSAAYWANKVKWAEGGEVDIRDDEGYADDLARLKRAYENSNFGPNDSVIASTIHHPIEAAKRYGQHLNDMYAIATDQLTDAELAAAKDAGYDEESYPLYAMEHPIFRTDAQKAEAGMEFAGLAQTGAMPFAPESAGGTLGMLIKPMKASEAYGQIEGRPLYVTQADRTKVGGKFLGGPGFSRLQLEDPEYAEALAAWAVQNPSIASTIINGSRQAGEHDPVFTTFIGAPDQHRSNQMVFDYIYNDFKKASKKSDLFTPEKLDLMNERLANYYKDKSTKENLFPENINILDKNLKKYANTFDKRAAIAEVIGGKGIGGKKGQIIDYDKLLRSTSDPSFLDVPSGSLGNRLFTLNGEFLENRHDLHPAFPTILQGEDLGLVYQPVPRELVMKDFYNKIRQEKGREPGYFDWALGYPPSQLITEDLLTEMQRAGYAKGGEVKDLHNKYEESDYGYGNRPDKTKKGLGYFGELERPDGTGVMTEYSIGVPIHGEEMDVPTLVPTLTPDEIRLILHMQDGEDMPRSIVHKAIDHAHQRLSEGKPIFATEEDLYAHGGIVDVLHNDAIEQIMKAFMDSMADDEDPSAPAVSIEITTQNTETPRRGKIPKSIAREAKHG